MLHLQAWKSPPAAALPPWRRWHSSRNVTCVPHISSRLAGRKGPAPLGVGGDAVVTLEQGPLGALGLELVHGSREEQELAALKLAGLASCTEHHSTLIQAGLLDRLCQAFVNPNACAEVRTIVLRCLGDLASQSAAAQRQILEAEGAAQEACAVLQARDGWGSESRQDAARLLAALCSSSESYPLLAELGVIQVILQHVTDMVADKAISRESQDVLNRAVWLRRQWERQEEEQWVASAIFEIAGSEAGRLALAQDSAILQQLYVWATSGMTLQRYSVGCVTRIVNSVPADAAAAVSAGGGSSALMAGLASSDPGVACTAAEGVRLLARQGGRAARALGEHFGLHEALFSMIEAPLRVALSKNARDLRVHFFHAPQQRHWSEEDAIVVQLAALEALLACSQEKAYLRPTLRIIDAAALLQALEARSQLLEPGRFFQGEALALCNSIKEGLTA